MWKYINKKIMTEIIFKDLNLKTDSAEIAYKIICENYDSNEIIFQKKAQKIIFQKFIYSPDNMKIFFEQTNLPINKKFKHKHFYVIVSNTPTGEFRVKQTPFASSSLINFMIIFSHRTIISYKVNWSEFDNGRIFDPKNPMVEKLIPILSEFIHIPLN
jgi:hypothetical protein